MTDFIDAEITTDATQLQGTALTQLNATLAAAGFPGWKAGDADLGSIILAIVGQVAASVASVSSTVLSAVFRAFGTQLVGIPYQNGALATVTSTWAFTSPAPAAGYLIPGGTGVLIDGATFTVPIDTLAAAGAASISIVLQAADIGVAFNGLGHVGEVVQPLTQIDWVSSVTISAATANGVDQQTDSDYQNSLAAALQLQAPRPITSDNYAGMVLSEVCLIQTGISVGRATSIDGYYPSALVATGTFVNAASGVTLNSLPYPYATPAIGASATGTFLPSADVVASAAAAGFSTGSFGITPQNTTGSANVESISISSWQNVERCVTTFVTDSNGQPLTAAQMAALQAWLNSYREANFEAFVVSPSYTTIYVTCSVHALPGYSATAVIAAVQAAIAAYLSPATWGALGAGQPPLSKVGWLNSADQNNVVRQKSLIAVAGNVPGVQYVNTMTLGLAPNPASTSDVTLFGPAPLPQVGTVTVTSV